MPLVRLVYTSHETEDIVLDDFRDILKVARANNERDRITGLLISSRPFFIQCLEGHRPVVARLVEKLYRDPRHAGIQIVSTREIDRRDYEAWSMRLARLDELESGAVRPICLRNGGDLPFDPTALREPQLLAWLREMTGYIASQRADAPRLAG